MIDMAIPSRVELRSAKAELIKARDQTAAVSFASTFTVLLANSVVADLEQHELYANGALQSQSAAQ